MKTVEMQGFGGVSVLDTVSFSTLDHGAHFQVGYAPTDIAPVWESKSEPTMPKPKRGKNKKTAGVRRLEGSANLRLSTELESRLDQYREFLYSQGIPMSRSNILRLALVRFLEREESRGSEIAHENATKAIQDKAKR